MWLCETKLAQEIQQRNKWSVLVWRPWNWFRNSKNRIRCLFGKHDGAIAVMDARYEVCICCTLCSLRWRIPLKRL